jgi:endonuclease YncB( thermonuclease family)
MIRDLLSVLVAFALLVSHAFADIRIVDGDTIVIDDLKIRLLEIDTPETYAPRCENEHVLGLKAKQRLIELFATRDTITVVEQGKDRYGRTLAYVYVGELNVGEQLLKEGLALPYRPGPKAKAERLAQWCRS